MTTSLPPAYPGDKMGETFEDAAKILSILSIEPGNRVLEMGGPGVYTGQILERIGFDGTLYVQDLRGPRPRGPNVRTALYLSARTKLDCILAWLDPGRTAAVLRPLARRLGPNGSLWVVLRKKGTLPEGGPKPVSEEELKTEASTLGLAAVKTLPIGSDRYALKFVWQALAVREKGHKLSARPSAVTHGSARGAPRPLPLRSRSAR